MLQAKLPIVVMIRPFACSFNMVNVAPVPSWRPGRHSVCLTASHSVGIVRLYVYTSLHISTQPPFHKVLESWSLGRNAFSSVDPALQFRGLGYGLGEKGTEGTEGTSGARYLVNTGTGGDRGSKREELCRV